MATYRHWSVSLWRDPDDVSHCRILSPDKTEWRLISATLCGWRGCFVADQLRLMKHIREEEECLCYAPIWLDDWVWYCVIKVDGWWQHITVLHTVSFEAVFEAKRQRQSCIVFKEVCCKWIPPKVVRVLPYSVTYMSIHYQTPPTNKLLCCRKEAARRFVSVSS